MIGPGAAELVQAAFNTRETPRATSWRRSAANISSSAPTASARRVPTLVEVEPRSSKPGRPRAAKLADAKVKAASRAEAGTDLATIAKELGLEARTAKAVTRFEADQPNYLTQPVVTALFKLAPGKVQSVRTAEGSVIVRLKQVETVDLAKDEER